MMSIALGPLGVPSLNLDAIPVWTIVLAEIFGLGLLGVTFWLITKPQFRRRIPAALAMLVVLALVQTRIQERGARVAAWIIVMVGLTLALSALGLHGGYFAEYWRIHDKYGEKSKEMQSHVWKGVLRILAILTILMTLSFIFIKGAYLQGA